MRRTPHWKSQNSLTWLLLQVKRSRNVQWKEDWKGYCTLLCGGKVTENYSGLPLPSVEFWRLKIQIQIHYSSLWRQSHWKLQRSASSISVLTPVTDIHPITAQPDYWYTWSIKDIVSRSFHSDTFFSLFQMLKPLDRPTRKYQFRGEKNKKKFLHIMTALQHTLKVLYNMLWFWMRCSGYACFGFVGQLKSCMGGLNFAWIVYGLFVIIGLV